MGGSQSQHKRTGKTTVTITNSGTVSAGATETSPSSINSKQDVLSFKAVDSASAKTWNPNSPGFSLENDERRYHGVESSMYVLPSDALEQDRLEMQHYLARAVYGSDIICPDVPELLNSVSGANVLDVGCARGHWLKCVQKVYPNANYFGVDIAEEVVTDPNNSDGITLKFGNVLDRLPFEDNTFDYVHQRLLILGMPKNKYVDAIRELIRVTKPGGWIELLEGDMIVCRPGPNSKILSMAMYEAMSSRGLDCFAAFSLPSYVDQLKEYVAVVGEKAASAPMNWGGDVGTISGANSKQALLAIEGWMHKAIGISREEYRDFVQKCFEEWKEMKSFTNSRSVYFQVKK